MLEMGPASFPAAVFTRIAFNFLEPREANGAIVVIFNPRLRTCL